VAVGWPGGGAAAVRASLGHLCLQEGAFADATSVIRQCLEELGRQGTELGIASAVCGIGRLAHVTGSPERAWRLLGAPRGCSTGSARVRTPWSCVRLNTDRAGISSTATLSMSESCAR
jgi:hypothetical protein